jgi:hypothetical protein
MSLVTTIVWLPSQYGIDEIMASVDQDHQS